MQEMYRIYCKNKKTYFWPRQGENICRVCGKVIEDIVVFLLDIHRKKREVTVFCADHGWQARGLGYSESKIACIVTDRPVGKPWFFEELSIGYGNMGLSNFNVSAIGSKNTQTIDNTKVSNRVLSIEGATIGKTKQIEGDQ